MPNNHIRGVIAVILIAFQSVMALVASLALFASAHRVDRWAFGATFAHRRAELGAMMFVVAAVACVIALFLASGAAWARVAAIVLEAFMMIGALARIGVHPAGAIVAIAVAVAVILLLATGASDRQRAAGATPGNAGAVT